MPIFCRAALAFLALLATATAQTVDCSKFNIILPLGPSVVDAAGWNQQAYSTTIHAADIDGDGQSEVIGRSSAGIEVWRHVNGVWLNKNAGLPLTDAAGWNRPEYYSTLQLATLDASIAHADLVGRAADGIHVWRYNPADDRWFELGNGSQRPFADADAAGTDWTRAEYYSTIQLADLDGDGQSELVGRGKDGLQIYAWQQDQESWKLLTLAAAFSDSTGFDRESTYYPIQFADLNGDGHAHLLVRAPGGMAVYRWNVDQLEAVAQHGPFSDSAAVYRSIRTFVDAQGIAWLFAVRPATAGNAAAIVLCRWQRTTKEWQAQPPIPLPGTGWDRPSQYLTLRAADLVGNGGIDLMVRSAAGLHLFQKDRAGFWRSTTTLESLSDANGFAEISHYATIQTARLASADNSGLRTYLLARGRNGIYAYKYNAAAGSVFTQFTGFPPWANANQLLAYQQLSTLVNGGIDVRQTYDLVDNGYTFWGDAETAMREQVGKQPSTIPSTDWEAARSQLQTEFSYVAAVRAWFANNQALSDYVFIQSAGQIESVSAGVTLSSGGGPNATIAFDISRFILDIVTQVSFALGDAQEFLPSGDVDPRAQVFEVANRLGDLHNLTTQTSACAITAYVHDWGALQAIGVGSTSGFFQWGSRSTSAPFAAAEVAATNAQELFLYKAISSATWKSWWCHPDQWIFGGCTANSSYPSKYIYAQYVDGNYLELTAYMVLNNWQYPDYDALARIEKLGGNLRAAFANLDGWNVATPLPGTEVCYPFPACYLDDSSISSPPVRAGLTPDPNRPTIAALQSLRDSVLASSASDRLVPSLEIALRSLARKFSRGAPLLGPSAPNSLFQAPAGMSTGTAKEMLRLFITSIGSQPGIAESQDFIRQAQAILSDLNQEDDLLTSIGRLSY